MKKLLNCPFCGGQAEIIKVHGQKIDTRVMPYRVPLAVICTNTDCGANMGNYYERQDAISAWNRRTAPENKPLTLEQIRQMDGEPVWVVHPNMKGWFEYNKEAGWYILEHFFGGGMGIKDSKMDTALSKESSYGRDWLAYACKPEQEDTP